MPAHKKPYNCVNCGTTNSEEFTGGRKSLCSKCLPLVSTNTRLLRKTFHCTVCGENNVDAFYPGNKSRCTKCILSKRFSEEFVAKSSTQKETTVSIEESYVKHKPKSKPRRKRIVVND